MTRVERSPKCPVPLHCIRKPSEFLISRINVRLDELQQFSRLRSSHTFSGHETFGQMETVGVIEQYNFREI